MRPTSYGLKTNMVGKIKKYNSYSQSATSATPSHTLSIPLGTLDYKNNNHAILCTDGDYSGFYFSIRDSTKDGEGNSGGGAFVPVNLPVVFKDGTRTHKPADCVDFRFAYNGIAGGVSGGKYIATYIHAYNSPASKVSKTNKSSKAAKKTSTEYYRAIATSKDMFTWKVISEIPIHHALAKDSIERASAVVVNDYIWNKSTVMYAGGTFITALTSSDLRVFDDADELLATTRINVFDSDEIRLMGSFVTDRGIAVIYDSRKFENPIDNAQGRYTLNVGAMLFDRDNPRRMIWRSEQPLWKSEGSFDYENKCTPLGALAFAVEAGKDKKSEKSANDTDKNGDIETDDELISLYWSFSDGSILVGSLKPFGRITHLARPDSLEVNRHHANPIITPTPLVHWEANGTFNPAAVMDDEDRVHLFYRAIGGDGVSRIGHSSSADGKRFYKKSLGPVYNPLSEEDQARRLKRNIKKEYNPSKYTSGGSWGGHEDPRAVRIEDKVYMTYTVFQGWHSVRIAITSIRLNDLKKEKWNWSSPKYISPPNEVHKNWVVFPEKIKGKYAILHSLSPKVLVDYVEDLNDPSDGGYIESVQPYGGRAGHWDNWMRGTATPPIKTDIGWLILYHAMDRNDPNKYKLGAMILDPKLGPKSAPKILYRSPSPILSPEACYENDGKPGVVYATGAIVKDDELYIYYGGGDKTVCLAHTPLKELLMWLVDYGKV